MNRNIRRNIQRTSAIKNKSDFINALNEANNLVASIYNFVRSYDDYDGYEDDDVWEIPNAYRLEIAITDALQQFDRTIDGMNNQGIW